MTLSSTAVPLPKPFLSNLIRFLITLPNSEPIATDNAEPPPGQGPTPPLIVSYYPAYLQGSRFGAAS